MGHGDDPSGCWCVLCRSHASFQARSAVTPSVFGPKPDGGLQADTVNCGNTGSGSDAIKGTDRRVQAGATERGVGIGSGT